MRFHVGQRVRIIRQFIKPESHHLHGKEGTIVSIGLPWSKKVIARYGGNPGTAHRVNVDGYGERWIKKNGTAGGFIAFVASDLAPLTDPGADKLIREANNPKPFQKFLQSTLFPLPDGVLEEADVVHIPARKERHHENF